jgi:predicted membrane protein
MRTVLQVLLFIAAVALTYFIYDSIQRPITFEKERTARYSETIEKLKDIRKAQLAFKDVHGRFTGDWDTLINFVKYDSVRMVRRIGNLTDSMVEKGITERKSNANGLDYQGYHQGKCFVICF